MQSKAVAGDDDTDDDLAAIPPPGGLRVGSAVRLVKKSTSRAFNRAASAAADAVAVARFLDDPDLDPLLPVFANARAGLWHVDLTGPRVSQCRFKSTDGHAAAAGGAGGSFPLSRLNLGVAAAAAAGGGAVVVDATRRGKRFPDALSRTVPIWAAVVNLSCRIWIEEGSGGGGRRGEEKGKEEVEGKEEERGRGPLLPPLLTPPWVPASERAKVEGRVEGWARLLLSTGVDLSSFARELSERPLVPVWIARRGGEGEGQGRGGGGEAARGPSSVEVTHAEGEEGEESSRAARTALYLFSASDPSARRATVTCGCSSSSSSGGGSSSSSAPKKSGAAGASAHPAHGCFDLSFDYEPGGGDDEEGWSRGLSARAFWAHRGALLSRGPEGFDEAAEELTSASRRRGRGGAGEEERPSAAPGASSPAWTFVCGTRLAVGNAAAAAAAAAATLCCSSSSPALFLGSEEGVAPAVVILGSGSGGGGGGAPAPPYSSSPSPSPLRFRAPVSPKRKLGLLEALPSVVAFASAHLLRGRTVLLTSDDDGESGEDGGSGSGNENAAAAAAAVLLACFSAPPRPEFSTPFGGGGSGSLPAPRTPPPSPPPPSRRPCGCSAPPRASREEVRARIAAVCGSAPSGGGGGGRGRGGGREETPPLPLSSSLPLLSVGKEAAKQLLMFVSPPRRPGGFQCPACRAGRPARLGAERAASAALGEEGKGEGRGPTRAPGVEA